ncbi:early transcribed membrane protein [Plasmodium gallinaceum]|uniref:Early transcribed membrane protein n=1 Tax=Plasmodium gallinaceum TaxID=5849 RepID=A0A1J1GQL6_PLAGA|nr:early transcribed membrane protein [Plasmodium gallinaceum]CRG94556.1 early transcribed membrane protein [Plasmodium gallinaceum]
MRVSKILFFLSFFLVFNLLKICLYANQISSKNYSYLNKNNYEIKKKKKKKILSICLGISLAAAAAAIGIGFYMYKKGSNRRGRMLDFPDHDEEIKHENDKKKDLEYENFKEIVINKIKNEFDNLNDNEKINIINNDDYIRNIIGKLSLDKNVSLEKDVQKRLINDVNLSLKNKFLSFLNNNRNVNVLLNIEKAAHEELLKRFHKSDDKQKHLMIYNNKIVVNAVKSAATDRGLILSVDELNPITNNVFTRLEPTFDIFLRNRSKKK